MEKIWRNVTRLLAIVVVTGSPLIIYIPRVDRKFAYTVKLLMVRCKYQPDI